jgi:hypothetical protein
MSAATLPVATLTEARRRFAAALPAMDRVYTYQFRKFPPQRRADAIAEARAVTWAAWYGLLRRGRDPAAVGPTGIATRSCLPVKVGRRLAGGGRLDVLDPRARRRAGVEVLSLGRRAGADATPEGWRGWLAEDNRVSPADEACFRIDFRDWLGRLPARKRTVALLLAEGNTTGAVARALGVTPGAVSQARAWLAASWGAFQAQAAVP